MSANNSNSKIVRAAILAMNYKMETAKLYWKTIVKFGKIMFVQNAILDTNLTKKNNVSWAILSAEMLTQQVNAHHASQLLCYIKIYAFPQ